MNSKKWAPWEPNVPGIDEAHTLLVRAKRRGTRSEAEYLEAIFVPMLDREVEDADLPFPVRGKSFQFESEEGYWLGFIPGLPRSQACYFPLGDEDEIEIIGAQSEHAEIPEALNWTARNEEWLKNWFNNCPAEQGDVHCVAWEVQAYMADHDMKPVEMHWRKALHALRQLKTSRVEMVSQAASARKAGRVEASLALCSTEFSAAQ